MNPYMKTADIDLTYVDDEVYRATTECPISDGVEFTFKVFLYHDEILTGGIDFIDDDYYEKEIVMWYKANRGYLRMSIKKTLVEEGIVDEEEISDSF